MELSDLPGVGPATIEKLKENGFENVLSIAVAHPMNLVDAVGITDKAARKIIIAAREGMSMGFKDGITVEKESNIKYLTTNSKVFDELMGGGIKSGGITEVAGEFGSGKTQVALQLCVNQIIADPDSWVYYIDTEGTFSSKRIRQMAEHKKADADAILSHILVGKAENSDHQVYLAEMVNDSIQKGKNIQLIVVDSLLAHFRAEYTGRGTLAPRQQMINKHMRTLQKIADLHNIIVFVTNQVSANPGVFYGNPNQAIGGNIVGHNSRERLMLRRAAKGTRAAKLYDSPDMPDGEVVYLITENGVEDIK